MEDTISIFYSHKAAKLAKKNNAIDTLKNLRVFAETFSVSVYPG